MTANKTVKTKAGKKNKATASEGIMVLHRARDGDILERATFQMRAEGYANRNEWYNSQLEKLAAKAPKAPKGKKKVA